MEPTFKDFVRAVYYAMVKFARNEILTEQELYTLSFLYRKDTSKGFTFDNMDYVENEKQRQENYELLVALNGNIMGGFPES